MAMIYGSKIQVLAEKKDKKKKRGNNKIKIILVRAKQILNFVCVRDLVFFVLSLSLFSFFGSWIRSKFLFFSLFYFFRSRTRSKVLRVLLFLMVLFILVGRGFYKLHSQVTFIFFNFFLGFEALMVFSCICIFLYFVSVILLIKKKKSVFKTVLNNADNWDKATNGERDQFWAVQLARRRGGPWHLYLPFICFKKML
jgi:hypothetical protein